MESIREEVASEVGQLLETVERKAARCADLQGRLEGRLRWGGWFSFRDYPHFETI